MMMPSSAESELDQVLRNYDLGVFIKARQIERGYANENWIIDTTQGRYFLKHRYPGLKNPKLIQAQHELVAYLLHTEFPAPEILATKSGDTLLMHDRRFYEIQTYIDGVSYQRDRSPHFHAAAAMLGRYHQSVQGFSNPNLREQGKRYCPGVLSNNLTKLMDAWKSHQDPEVKRNFRLLKASVSELTDRFGRHPQLPEIVIHGDYHADNLIFKNDRIVGVVDYDKSSWQPRVAELAEALIFFSSASGGPLRHLVYSSFLSWNRFEDFLRSYASVSRSDNLESLRQSYLSCSQTSEKTKQAAANTFPNAHELRSLPDYIRCIWISKSLQRLFEKGPFLTDISESVREVVTLDHWAAKNTPRMLETGCTALEMGTVAFHR
jgi:homoserine kinase type II